MIPTTPQTRYYIIAGSVGACCILFLLVYGIVLTIKTVHIDRMITAYTHTLDAYRKGARNFPSEERKEYLLMQEKALGSLKERIHTYPLFWQKTHTQDSARSPLKFKEELFQTKHKLRKEAAQYMVSFPQDIGFLAWERNLPQPDQLDELRITLQCVKTLGENAIRARIRSIDEIIVGDMQAPQAKGVSKLPAYTQTITIRGKGKGEEIMAFISSIHTSSQLLLVDSLLIDNAVVQAQKKGSAVSKEKNKGKDKDKTDVPYDETDPELSFSCTVRAVWIKEA